MAMSLPPDHSAARIPVGGQNPPRTPARFRETALASGLLASGQIDACEQEVSRTLGAAVRGDAARWDSAVADCLVAREKLTRFQADQLLAGRRKLTLGQYQILDELGRGGMGQVFRAQHVMMGRTVAIKVLPRAKSTSETEAAFQREIRMLGRLDHDHLVRALDAGHDGKVYYLVTELVPGIDLRRQVLKYGRLDELRAASVISQAAEGLGYAHGQGLVHRDVKPANLLVTPEGHVKVLDLGLAGSVIEGESTRLGRVVGTMDYMAPEQIRAVDAVGPSADVYALGCTLYFALTGEVPFPGGTRQEKMQRQLSEQPRPIRQLATGVSEDLCRVVDAMMRKNPAERLPSAQAVIERLRPWTPQLPLAMPRVKQGRSARAEGGSESVGGVPSSPRLPVGSSQGQELSVVEHQSTRGLLSEAEETDRGSGPHADSQSSPLSSTRAAADAGWGRLLVRKGMVAAAAAAILALVVWMVFGEDQQGGSGGELPVVVGVAAFFLILVVQFILAAVRVAGREEP
jgi:serine/threonine protein kinase